MLSAADFTAGIYSRVGSKEPALFTARPRNLAVEKQERQAALLLSVIVLSCFGR